MMATWSLENLVIGSALVGGLLWLWLHAWTRRRATVWWFRLLRVLVGTGALWATSELSQRWVTFATEWPLWTLALGGAFGVEALRAVYRYERLLARKWGAALLACRAGLLLALVMMLAQPVRSLDRSRTLVRSVALLVDDSASMHIADTQLPNAEKVRLGEALLADGPTRPYRLEGVSASLQAMSEEVSAQASALAALGDAPGGDAHREAAGRRIAAWREALDQRLQELSEPLSGVLDLDAATRAALEQARSDLSAGARSELERASERLSSASPAGAQKLAGAVSGLRRSAGSLQQSAQRVRSLSDRVDATYYASLEDSQRQRIDSLAQRTRGALAEALLRGATGADGLLGLCDSQYNVRLYRFAGEVREQSLGDSSPASAPATETRDQGRTDLAGALDRALSDVPAGLLAGVVVLSDGRHNAASPVVAAARRLRARNVPLCAVAFGADRGPRDAAIAAIDAPDTVYLKDRTLITARVKLDGLAGRSVRVNLVEDGRVLDSRELRAASDAYRGEVRLADEPQTAGLHEYRIIVEPQGDEAFDANNEQAVTVYVTDDRARLLMIDGRPRWEFRYLKNLFENRDRTVRLQYVLTRPDLIAAAPPRNPVPASASRPLEDAEATALPADASEWAKFDVVVLGDVSPDALSGEHVEALRKFVVDRGGTLITIAGPCYMPHAFGATPLRDLLPVVFRPSQRAVTEGAEDSFRITLTDEGRRSPIMRQAVSDADNERIWASMPEVYWRYPNLSAKPGAKVMAFALGKDAPDYVTDSASERGGGADVRARRMREQFQRHRALITCHNVGLGRVLFLSFDRTWRMRYRAGDLYHHRFWGQVLRWASGGRLPAGTALVKLGVERGHYRDDERVQVRARIVREDLSPLVSDRVAVKVSTDGKVVLKRSLDRVEDTPGLYSADLGAMPPGEYSVELDAPEARAMLDAEGVRSVRTQFAVDAGAPEEQIELGADRALLSNLVEQAGGVMVEPWRARGVLQALGDPELVRHDRRDLSLWASWPLLILMLSLVTLEWLIRKRAGLI
jgi:hypothetical protein